MKKAIALLLALVMVLALCACGSTKTSEPAAAPAAEPAKTDAPAKADAPAAEPAKDDGKVYKFTLSMHDPKTTANAIYIQSWIDKVAEVTNNKVQITLYDNATLSAATDIGDNVKAGAVDIGWLYTSYYAGQFPLSDVINLPMQGFGDPLVSTNVLWDLADKYSEVEGEWGDFKLLMLYGNPGMILCTSDSPITTKEDLKGRIIRCPAGGITDVLTAWGASPIAMAPPDLYEAVEKNNINGYIFEPAGICNFSLEEITSYYTDYPLYDGPFALIMNKGQWDSLPAEYQQAIDGISGKDASIGAAQAFADDVVAKREKIEAAGGQFVELEADAITSMQADADAVAQAWIDNMSKDGFDAAAYLADAKAFAASYK